MSKSNDGQGPALMVAGTRTGCACQVCRQRRLMDPAGGYMKLLKARFDTLEAVILFSMGAVSCHRLFAHLAAPGSYLGGVDP